MATADRATAPAPWAELPTATVVRRPPARRSGRPSAARQRRIHDRLPGSAFTRET